ncbi:MAK10-like protein [Tanacetum coccineum]|uniref:MAK10-like protein n=1 Tax=Tanacetum coccineum TaxID=301880 RepID=A0ABQ5EL99_9ASTR
MERFKNTIFKQHEEINGRMTEMFGLLKELTTIITPKKVLIREEAKFPITKNVNSISLARNEKEENNKTDETPDNTKMPIETEMPVRKAEAINKAENGAGNESIKTLENDEAVEAPRNNKFNNSLSGTLVGKKMGNAYKVLPRGPFYDVILKKKITKKEDVRGNFKIPCSIGDLKHMNALVDQGSDVNVMPYSTYMRLTNEKPAETDISVSLASHSFIYSLGIDEDVLVEVAEHVFPVDFLILDIKENEKDLWYISSNEKGIVAWRSFDEIQDNLKSFFYLSQCRINPHVGPTPQLQALGTTFEARVRDYIAAHTERMERFENNIFKQREEINGRMTEMFKLLKEHTTSRTPQKVLIREEAKFPITKNVNSISLARNEEKENNKTDETPDNTKMPIKMEMPVRKAEAMNGAENGARNKSIKTPKNDEAVEAPGSQPIAYYLKHKINEKQIKGLVKNNRFNNSLLGTRVGKKKGKAYKVLPGDPFMNIGDLKHVNALVDQGSDVNIMPYSNYMRLTDERPDETDIRLSLASHSYIYPLGIAEDVLVEVAEHVFPVDFVIFDIKENENRPFILGTPFLTTAKATIKFDIGTITLKSGKS